MTISLGLNLSVPTYFSPAQPFLNVLKCCDRWADSSSLSSTITLDSAGYPTAIPAGKANVHAVACLSVPAAPGCLPYNQGTYVFLYSGGAGTVWSFGGDVVSGTQDGSSNRWILSVPSATSAGIFLYITTMGSPHPTDMAIIYSPGSAIGGVIGAREAAYNSGEFFDPDWYAKVSPFKRYRFVDWMSVNRGGGNAPFTSMSFSQRPLTSQFTWAADPSQSYASAAGPGNIMPYGVPIEVMCALCNKAGADAWFNMPPLTTGTYYSDFATTVKSNLNSPLKCYVEFSNENWNFAFQNPFALIPDGFTHFPATQSKYASFTGSISGSVLNVTAVSSGTIRTTTTASDNELFGSGITLGLQIVSFGTGTGGTGTYNLSGSPGTIGSEAMTQGGYVSAVYDEWVYQTQLVLQAFASVWTGGDRARLIVMQSGQGGGFSSAHNWGQAGLQDYLLSMLATYDGGSSSYWTGTSGSNVDAYAIAPYFYTSPAITGSSTLTDLFNDINTENTQYGIPAWISITASNKTYITNIGSGLGFGSLPLIGYESGQSFTTGDSTMNTLFTNANRDSRMEASYTTYYNGLVTSGMSVVNHYNDISGYGGAYWGALESFLQTNLETIPKYDALLDLLPAAATVTLMGQACL